ncbi:hypothetical protein HYS31_07395 [Candidatus Woesearchaeota archaeon]|nr:hypothetical protein [Candidatus Woesearchaeota archaeon]
MTLHAEDFEFYNFPKKIAIEEYNELIQSLSKKLSKSGAVHSLYTWGNISGPGISDLDIMVVLKKGKRLSLRHSGIYWMGRKARYILVHPFIVIGEEIAQHARFIYPDAKFKKIFGKYIKFEEPSKIKDVRTALLNDIIIRHLPRDFLAIAHSGKIDARVALLRLNSLNYSLRLCSQVTGNRIKGAADYENRILELRNDWFNLDVQKQKEEIVVMISNAIGVSAEIINGFNLYLEKNGSTAVDDSISKVTYSGNKNKTIFKRGWKKADAAELSEDYVRLPINLAAQLVCYSGQKGPISRYIRNNLHPNKTRYRLRYSDIAMRRIKVINSQAEIAEHLHFPAFFDFGYRPNKSLLHKVASVARRLAGLKKS